MQSKVQHPKNQHGIYGSRKIALLTSTSNTLNQLRIPVGTWPRYAAHPGKLCHVQAPVLVRWVVPEKGLWDIGQRQLGPADPLALRPRVRHARADTRPRHLELQLRKHASHLQEGVGHGVYLAPLCSPITGQRHCSDLSRAHSVPRPASLKHRLPRNLESVRRPTAPGRQAEQR